MNHSDWQNPVRNFAYSQGEPSSRRGKNSIQKTQLLKGTNGEAVPCYVSHNTCQGVKALRERLEHGRALDASVTSVKHLELKCELIERTLAYFQSLKTHGCILPPSDETGTVELQLEYEQSLGSEPEVNNFHAQVQKARRGHLPRPSCSGNLVFEYDKHGKAYIRCEYFSRTSDRSHLLDYGPSSGKYDLRYLEALFFDDVDTIEDVEDELFLFKPASALDTCDFIMNCSSVRVNCPSPHRNHHGELVKAELEQLECKCTFRVYEPTEEFRSECPWILVVSKGVHHHPIPILSKTPPALVDEIMGLLHSLVEDLADMTPRRFLRHTTVQAYLKNALSHIQNPCLSDLHPSFANRDHLRSYILRAQNTIFPHRTGWEGLLHIKESEESRNNCEPYIRYMLDFPGPNSLLPLLGLAPDEVKNGDGDIDLEDEGLPLRIVICMSRASSRRLLKARSVQMDISFKRVSGFLEFEMGGFDDATKTSVVFCRAYITRQDTVTHAFLFSKIAETVKNDTGSDWSFRHLSARRVDEAYGTSLVNIDQHGGQAKGFGLFLKLVARRLPDRLDLHEPHRRIQDLDEYDHLRRLVRLCTAHIFRNIQKCAVPDGIKKTMRSLVCMHHADWEGALSEIRANGGKAGNDWLNDKIRSKFAFPAMCWEKSFIPELIWQMGESTTNLIEALHADANREGVACSLVGGFYKGLRFDELKEKTLKTYEEFGIHSSYYPATEETRITRSLKRRATTYHRVLNEQDQRIENANKRIKTAHDGLVDQLHREMEHRSPSGARSIQRAKEKFEKALAGSVECAGTGSGRVPLLLPPDTARQLHSTSKR
ncbi:hypothetical protein CC1G_01025 [Coprinopsis cinerea okayama7|uniref:Uncharacterized protein n=1 Tax=Coprinopsis cinerea (strain Okayama-7 / 130 / ATCC MYA-4618 / FGSC 9003) TaxID=240176 RepID=A8NE91_COPC7|nr:hypothetical protein CC1G_01025 [Coprinopsis cinerea okayama7\|eukprot:XP_001832963.2 hypothetical protein CC1G_01025 [Coprinopsis cinerea okayama7\